jgi:hypothetical protein
MPANGQPTGLVLGLRNQRGHPDMGRVVNTAGKFAASTNAELTTICAKRANALSFRDITLGNCGPYGALFSATGYDLCTGGGSDQGKTNK